MPCLQYHDVFWRRFSHCNPISCYSDGSFIFKLSNEVKINLSVHPHLETISFNQHSNKLYSVIFPTLNVFKFSLKIVNKSSDLVNFCIQYGLKGHQSKKDSFAK